MNIIYISTVGLGDFQPKVNPPYGCRVFGAKLYCSMDKIGLINAFHVEKILSLLFKPMQGPKMFNKFFQIY